MDDLTEEEIGKPVVAANETEVGHVEGVDGETLYVALNDGIEVNWGKTDEGTYALGADAIDAIDEEEVRLRGAH